MLGLKTGAAGGPAVEKLALNGNPKAVALPVPMQRRKDCDFRCGQNRGFRGFLFWFLLTGAPFGRVSPTAALQSLTKQVFPISTRSSAP